MVVDGKVKVFPADAAAVALTGAVVGDPMCDMLEASELRDVDVDQLARSLALVTPHRLGRLERRNAVQSEPAQHAADRRRPQPSSCAICWPVKRWRRSASIQSAVEGGGGRCSR